MIRAANEARRRDRNDRMELAWQTARLTAYAPEKGSKFPRLDSLLTKKTPRRQAQVADWREQFAAVSAFIDARKSRGAFRG